jgi:predicted TIM-barrel fold metal-dependent hydrolase
MRRALIPTSLLVLPVVLCGLADVRAEEPSSGVAKTPDQIRLKDYRPVSLHKVPVTKVTRARYPIIDMHSHAYAKTPEDVDRWVKLMDEEGDKGMGLEFGRAKGLHFDDPRVGLLLDRCADLGLPVNVHVADPIWMYQKMDETNDGMMNAVAWRLDDKPGIVDHAGMMAVLERAVRAHPRTTFVACHFANLDYDLAHLGELLDRLPNLYADISARYAETAVIPRFAAQFYARYQDRLVYGTDMGFDPEMYRTTFRILETLDEHFYAPIFGYHWSYSGFGLPDPVLEKLYRTNAQRVAAAAAANARPAPGR